MKKETKKKIMDLKWKNMEAAGLERPESDEENQERARNAHIPSEHVG